jgi:PPOX class probable F420-dependent enzyme
LETFRKTGVGVKTPVWFVEEQGTLYVRTEKGSAKVKRMRHNPSVRVVPSDGRGAPKGDWVAAQASLIDASDTGAHVNTLMNRKYGFVKRLFDLRGMFAKVEMATVAIVVQGEKVL